LAVDTYLINFIWLIIYCNCKIVITIDNKSNDISNVLFSFSYSNSY